MTTMHDVDFEIHGDDMQFVEVELDPREAAIAEAGAMMYMDDGIAMETIFGDGSEKNSGFLGSLMGAGKRLLTGESLFMTLFANEASGKRTVAFGAPHPGKIIPVYLPDVGGRLIVQKDAFLCAGFPHSVGYQSSESRCNHRRGRPQPQNGEIETPQAKSGVIDQNWIPLP